MRRPVLQHIANLWTLMGHPSMAAEWSLDEKLDAIRDAGFDGVCWAPSEALQRGAILRDLTFLGGMASGDESMFGCLLSDLRRYEAKHVNVQLGTDGTLPDEALHLTLKLMKDAEALGLKPVIETHRGTCTETPEKMYALADAYQRATGKLLSISWDFSHYAVVKHLEPSNFCERLLIRQDLIQHAQQFHFRPFNGHHAQVPILTASGDLTNEVLDWLPFAEAIFACWLKGNQGSEREIFVCPELGPVAGGYALSTFPNRWEETLALKREIDRIWTSLKDS